MVNLTNIWLALGIALTTATQLRPESLPIGIGEVMLILWMIASTFKIASNGYYLINPIFKTFGLFWLVSVICLIFGFFIAYNLGIVATDLTYNVLALTFVAFFSLFLAIYLVEVKDFNQLIILIISLTVISFLVLLLFPKLLPIIQPWYGEIRFTGWSNNPNQAAILLSMMPFLLLHLITQYRQNKLTKIWCIFLIFCIIIIGVLTDSDALRISWISGLSALCFFQLNIFIPKLLSRNKDNYQNFIYTTLFRLIILVIALIFIFLSSHQEEIYASEVYNKDSQGSVRLTLWLNGLIAISYSPLFGLGPGFFSGIPEPFANFEAHNTFIDWTASVGIIGLVNYLILLTWIAGNTWKRKLLILLAAIISLVGFSSFHYVFRHPVFWFYLLTIAWWSINNTNSNLKLQNWSNLQNY